MEVAYRIVNSQILRVPSRAGSRASSHAGRILLRQEEKDEADFLDGESCAGLAFDLAGEPGGVAKLSLNGCRELAADNGR